MKLTAIIDRLDDWINPIVVKELRQAVRRTLARLRGRIEARRPRKEELA